MTELSLTQRTTTLTYDFPGSTELVEDGILRPTHAVVTVTGGAVTEIDLTGPWQLDDGSDGDLGRTFYAEMSLASGELPPLASALRERALADSRA